MRFVLVWIVCVLNLTLLSAMSENAAMRVVPFLNVCMMIMGRARCFFMSMKQRLQASKNAIRKQGGARALRWIVCRWALCFLGQGGMKRRFGISKKPLIVLKKAAMRAMSRCMPITESACPTKSLAI